MGNVDARGARGFRGSQATIAFALAGVASGIAIKALDKWASNAANIFSHLSVWVLICVAIVAVSATLRRAALNVFLFCAGMLVSYYLFAEFTGAAYSVSFAVGWAAFSLLTPLFSCVVWYARGEGAGPKIVGALVIAATLLATVVLFDKVRIWDLVFAIPTAVLLFADRRRRG